MSQTKTIQLLRSSALYADKEAAKSAIIARTAKDGEVILARYQSGTDTQTGNLIAKSLLGIYHAAPDLTPSSGSVQAGWTVIEDSSTVDAILEGLDFTTGNMTFEGGSAIDDSVIVVGVAQNNGQLDAVVAELGSVKVNSVTATSATSKIAAEQTLSENLGRLQGQIDDMDLTQVGGTDGDIITTVSQADGKVSASKSSLTDVAMTGYSKTNDTGAIAATDTLEEAFSKVENTIAATTVKSTDKTVTITDNSGKDLAVNIDGTTLVKNSSTGVISSDLKVIKVIPSGTAGTDEVVDSNLATNVKEAYRLVYGNSTTAIGQQINVYKDSSLKEVYLGASTDTINASTGVITKNTVTDPQSMNFAYQLADGTYSLVKIDVSKFLTDSEFSDGLQVNGGVVSVKKDTSSGKVRIAATPSGVTPDSADDTGLVDVLTVSSNGVKVDNIQAAINYAVQNSSTSLAISAEGDNYITAAVDANNNKKINVTADVQSLTATAGTPGVYDSTGTQTTAPVAGTLSGTADSLADGSDIASKVKTYVDGAIAIEGARSDAKNVADLKAAVESLNGEALASTAPTAVSYSGTNSDEFQVLTRVNEVDGIVQAVDATANSAGSKSVTLKKVAATGAAADVSIADSGSLITADTVEGALQEIAGKANTALQSVSSGNDAISVGTKSNNDQTVSLVLDVTTQNNNITSDMLQITGNGLMMKDTWDCGVF